MPATMRKFVIASSILSTALIVGCAGSNSPTAPDATNSAAGTSTSPAAPSPNTQTGSLTINLTDSPFSDAKSLLVSFSSVSVHRADGDAWQTVPFTSGGTRTCDLKKLDGPVDVLGVGALPAGKYTQVRLVVSSAALYFDNAAAGSACAASIDAPAGESAAVDVPSGEIKLNHEFTVSGGTTMLLDFDGDQSVRQTGGGSSGNGNGNSKGNGGGTHASTKYMMSPVVRVVSVQ